MRDDFAMRWFERVGWWNWRGDLEMVADGEAGTRTNILAASVEDEQRMRDRPAPPLAGWCFRGGTWLRWSELDADYVPRPVPASLLEYGERFGGPPEGHVVAMVDGEWREVADGAAPLRVPAEGPRPEGSGAGHAEEG